MFSSALRRSLGTRSSRECFSRLFHSSEKKLAQQLEPGSRLVVLFAPRSTGMTRTFRLLSTNSNKPLEATGRAVVTKEERAALRAARKEQAAQFLLQQRQQQSSPTTAATSQTQKVAGATVATSNKSSQPGRSAYLISRFGWMVYGGIPIFFTGLAIWAINDDNSPPAKFSKLIGLTQFVRRFADEYAKPAHDKLLPDWSQMPNVPHDIPIPPTLVLDLEGTLVGSTWDRKYGWRHAKRPGVDKFLQDMAQYYEIVLYSPSPDGLAGPVVEALDKNFNIMHRLFRDATFFHNGIHVKDLNRLNRNLKRIVVLDDDPAEVQFNPENLIRIKPYQPGDQGNNDDDALARITPFLIELAREGYDDFQSILRQYRGMDSDEIADEQDRRLNRLKQQRMELRQRGLGSLARQAASHLVQAPELPPGSFVPPPVQQLTAKDIVGQAAISSSAAVDAPGLVGFFNRRAKEKEEHQMRKMEKWSEVMMKKHKEKEAAAKAKQQQLA